MRSRRSTSIRSTRTRSSTSPTRLRLIRAEGRRPLAIPELPGSGWTGSLVAALTAATGEEGRDAFARFVFSSPATKWFVACDFVIDDKGRDNDAFAFTVFPWDAALEDLLAEIRHASPHDLKQIKRVAPAMLSYLRSPRRLHFVFVPNRDRRLVRDHAEAREALGRTIDEMRASCDADHRETIKAFERLRREALARGFKLALFGDIMLLATLAGFIASLLQADGRAEEIVFCADRDNMTSAYGAVVNELFSLNAVAFAQRHHYSGATLSCALPGPRPDGTKGNWYDEFVRIPDFLAGAASGTDFQGSYPVCISEKCAQIVSNVFTDNPCVTVLQLYLPPHETKAVRLFG